MKNVVIIPCALVMGFLSSCASNHHVEVEQEVKPAADAQKCHDEAPLGMTVLIAGMADPSLVQRMTEEDFKKYLPKAKKGDIYAMNKMVQYYLQNDDERRAEKWGKKRNAEEKKQHPSAN